MRRLYFFFIALPVAIGLIGFGVYKEFFSMPNGAVQEINSSAFKNVVLVSDSQATTNDVHLIFPFGEMDSTYAEGLLHYVEHLAWLSAFKGEQGARHANAWTSQFSTGYWQRTTDKDLTNTIQRLLNVADPIDLDPTFALEERKIVQREYDFRISERTLYGVYRDIQETLYQDGPLARSVIGTPDGIAGFDLETAKALHQESHRIADATLVVRGNLRERDLAATLANFDLGSKDPSHVEPSRPDFTPLRDVRSERVAGQSELLLIYRRLIPLPECGDTAKCDLMRSFVEDVLDSTLPEGLGGPLRFDAFIARSFGIDLIIPDHGFLEISFSAAPDQGVPPRQVLSTFEDTLDRTLTSGISDATFQRVKERQTGGLNSILDVAGHNHSLVIDQLATNQPIFELEDQKQALNELSLSEINNFLKDINKDSRTVVRLINSIP